MEKRLEEERTGERRQEEGDGGERERRGTFRGKRWQAVVKAVHV